MKLTRSQRQVLEALANGGRLEPDLKTWGLHVCFKTRDANHLRFWKRVRDSTLKPLRDAGLLNDCAITDAGRKAVAKP